MEKVVVHYHRDSDTMDIWFDDPEGEFTCEEASEGIILKKQGRQGYRHRKIIRQQDSWH